MGTVEWFDLFLAPFYQSLHLLGFPGTFRLNATVPA